MGKLPLGKLSFEKMYIWEVAAWEKAFQKVPNIHIMYLNQFLKMMILLSLNESLP